jgi:uncharacterized RDD family membrane protein YckC
MSNEAPETPVPGRKEAFWSKLIDSAITWIVPIAIVAGAVLLSAMVWRMTSGDSSILQKLSSPEYARGLITFIFAVVTVAVALFLLLFLTGNYSEEMGKKFALGKEIFTVLIGVFGTILGFYFGSATTAERGLTVATPRVANVSTTSATVTTFISGGEPPYTYVLLFDPENAVSGPVGGKSADGWVQATVGLQQPAPGPRVKYRIVVSDSRGKAATIDAPTDSEIVIPPATAAPPAPNSTGQP